MDRLATTWRSALLLVLLWPAGLGAAPPQVVRSTVEDGQDDVDPALTEIRVEFDQPMSRQSWSIVGGGPTFPAINVKPRWADERTVVITVGLRPGREYWLSLNSDTFHGFRSAAAGEPAVPQPLSFRTRAAAEPAEPADPLAPERHRAAAAALRRAVDDHYGYRDRLGLDWDKLFAEHAPAMGAVQTPNQFARAAAKLLRSARDAHVYVRAGDRTIATHVNPRPANLDLQTLRRTVADAEDHPGGVVSGKLAGGDVGYLLVPEWSRPVAEGLDAAYAAVKGSKALVIDVRANGGGDEVIARAFAGRFVAEPKVYSTNRTRRDGRWLGPYDRVVEPRPAAERYHGRVAVLIGPAVASSCESFVLMMRQAPRCKLVGDVTKGSSGNPRPHDLGNGVTVFLSSWEDRLPDGTILEGRGVTPDVVVRTTPAALRQRDAVLDAALDAVSDRPLAPAEGPAR